jgi:hypothetical protein
MLDPVTPAGLDTDNPRIGSGELNNQGSNCGGIDKSVLAISEPRRVRDKEHRRGSFPREPA